MVLEKNINIVVESYNIKNRPKIKIKTIIKTFLFLIKNLTTNEGKFSLAPKLSRPIIEDTNPFSLPIFKNLAFL